MSAPALVDLLADSAKPEGLCASRFLARRGDDRSSPDRCAFPCEQIRSSASREICPMEIVGGSRAEPQSDG